jgi:threonine aldolase
MKKILLIVSLLCNFEIIPMTQKSFASDNYAGIHPDILEAIIAANKGHEKAYGNDVYTQKAIELFKHYFGKKIDVYFVLTGTAANVLGLQMLLHSFQAILCAESAHINVDECGAPENYTGSKLLPIATKDGKLTVDLIKNQLFALGDQHKVQPKVISITQSTELGTLYTPEEIKAITDFAHAHNMYVHMDGARFCNAAAALNVPFAALTTDVGIDLLSFGGTKNGMMLGEAVIFFNKELSENFKYIRKQGMQLASKMRFIAAQFIALLSNDLWLKNALHANHMAQLLAQEVAKISQIKISRNVEANAVFAFVDPELIPLLQEKYFFYVWDEVTSEVRWMTSFDTTKEDVMDFVAYIQESIQSRYHK